MFKARMIMFGLLAAFALSAIASTSASAAEHNFKIEGKAIKGEKKELQGSSGLAVIETTIASVKVQIICQEDRAPDRIENEKKEFVNLLEEKGKTTYNIEFKNCVLWGVEKRSEAPSDQVQNR